MGVRTGGMFVSLFAMLLGRSRVVLGIFMLPAHGDVRPGDDDALLRGDERRRCDDALVRDASAIVPSLGSSVF